MCARQGALTWRCKSSTRPSGGRVSIKSSRLSTQKSKGRGNAKKGNKYLSWANAEAAHFIVCFNPKARRFYQPKRARTCGALAVKAPDHKLARATYYIMRDKVAFNEEKLFG